MSVEVVAVHPDAARQAAKSDQKGEDISPCAVLFGLFDRVHTCPIHVVDPVVAGEAKGLVTIVAVLPAQNAGAIVVEVAVHAGHTINGGVAG